MRPFAWLDVGVERRCALWVWIMWAAMGDIFWAVWSRGCRSQRQVILDMEEGSSDRPWMVQRMPDIV
jgi:hypothetical protein